MRNAIACGLVFGAIALLPPAATTQFAEKKVLTLVSVIAVALAAGVPSCIAP